MTDTTPIHPPLSDADIASIERATLDAVAPASVEGIDGWLLPFDPSTIGRAKSAVPLRHHSLSAQDIASITARYQAHGMAPGFRVADVVGLADVCAALASQGLAPQQPTLTQVGSVASLRAFCQGTSAVVSQQPTAEWASVYTAPGFDPVDGAFRMQALSRSATVVYACVIEDGQAVAAGTASLSQGWASIHGMRTVVGQRGRGLAGRVLAGLAQAALAQGLERVFLQVEEENAGAIALYRKAGFHTAWRYHYWR